MSRVEGRMYADYISTLKGIVDRQKKNLKNGRKKTRCRDTQHQHNQYIFIKWDLPVWGE